MQRAASKIRCGKVEKRASRVKLASSDAPLTTACDALSGHLYRSDPQRSPGASAPMLVGIPVKHGALARP